MNIYTKRGRDVFAPTTSDGQLRSPVLGEAQTWANEVERSIDGAVAGRVDAANWASLAAIPGSRAGQPALIVGPDAGTHTDPVTGQTVSNTGSYAWSISPAGWRRIGGVPSAVVPASNTGTGTANAVQATTDIAFDATPGKTLFHTIFVADNTGPMTLALNGETPRELVTNSGDSIISGYIKAGTATLFTLGSDGKYHLLSYGDAEAVQAAAENALADIKQRDLGAFADAAAADAYAASNGITKIAGTTYFNTTDDVEYRWTGSSWIGVQSTPVIDDPAMASNSATAAPSQASAKSYIDGKFGSTGSTIALSATKRDAMSIIVGEEYRNVSLQYGLPKDNTGDISVKLNELLGNGTTDGPDALPVGSTLVLEPGRYRCLNPIIQKRRVNIKMASNAQILGVFSSDPTKDIWRVLVDAGLCGYAGDNRQMIMEGGLMSVASGLSGRHALHIGAGTVGASFGIHVRNMLLGGQGVTNGGRAVYMTGYVDGVSNGPTFCIIEACDLNQGVHLDHVADGNRILNNVIHGELGVVLDIVGGAYCTTVDGNAIVSRDGLRVIDASQIIINANQFEIPAAYSIAQVQNLVDGIACHLSLIGSARRIAGATITNNNFGGGAGRMGIPIIVDNAEQSWIDHNKYNPGDNNVDIRFTADAFWNHVGRNNRVRGVRTGGVYPARPDRKLRVQDLGTGNGNSGFWRDVPALQNGWTWVTNENAQFIKDEQGRVNFAGELTPGTLTDNTLLWTMPAGYRPYSITRVVVAAKDSGGAAQTAVLQFSSDGTVRMLSHTGTPDRLYMSSVSYMSQWRDEYADRL